MPSLVAWPNKKIAAVAGLLAAFGYLLLAGGPDNVPAFRSTLMLALIFGAALVGRRALTMRNVAIAALVIILTEPTSVFRPSFQLSFAAVVALIGVYELPRRGGAGKSGSLERFVRFVLTTAATSFIAGLATLLFSAYHFQQTAPPTLPKVQLTPPAPQPGEPVLSLTEPPGLDVDTTAPTPSPAVG